jgi:hypothetical protein
MNKKLKKAYKIVKKYEKEQAKIAEKNDFRKYEDPGCFNCIEGQIIISGSTHLDITCFKRCPCSKIKTKRYKKFLKNEEKLKKEMSAFDFENLKNKWYDNNSNITEGNDSVDRSW